MRKCCPRSIAAAACVLRFHVLLAACLIGSLTDPMRVLFITGEYPPLQGGIADYTAALRAELHALDVTSEVLTDSACASTEPTVHPVVSTWSFPFWSIAQQIISERQIDVVHIQYQTAAFDLNPAINLLPWYLRRRAPRPSIVTTFHDLHEPYLFPKAGPVRRWVTRMLGRHSDSLIFTTQADREKWGAAGDPNIPASQKTPTHRIDIGATIAEVPITAERRQALRAECGVAPHAFLVGFFGFVNHTKGLDTLFKAVRLLRDRQIPVQVLIVGGSLGDSDPTNAVYKEHLEHIIRRLDLDMGDILLSTGYLEAADASRALATCDALALPFTDGVSLRRTSLLAALDHGLPVVTTYPKHPTPELQESDALLLVPPDDPRALSDTLHRLYENPAQGETLSAAARHFARRFSWPLIAEHTLAVYSAACQRK